MNGLGDGGLSREEMEERIADEKEVALGHGKVPIEDFDELALDPSNVALSECSRDHRPVDVFQSRVIGVL